MTVRCAAYQWFVAVDHGHAVAEHFLPCAQMGGLANAACGRESVSPPVHCDDGGMKQQRIIGGHPAADCAVQECALGFSVAHPAVAFRPVAADVLPANTDAKSRRSAVRSDIIPAQGFDISVSVVYFNIQPAQSDGKHM